MTSPRAADAPHDFDCMECHQTHYLNGNPFTAVQGAENVCLSCHQPGGLASAHAQLAGDQASLWNGLATQLEEFGRSHRWDSSPAGRVVPLGLAPASALVPGGRFDGPYPTTFNITINGNGDLGEAGFDWTSGEVLAGSGTAATGTDVPLGHGVTVSFSERTYRAGESWQLLVRPDLTMPSNPEVAGKFVDGHMVCSTCHNQHSQDNAPFDPTAPESGAGRHFMRVANDVNQLCRECHANRFVTDPAQGSHPVDVHVPTTAAMHPPADLPLDATEGKLRCTTCHQVHDCPGDDGRLLRLARQNDLCSQCHASVDVATPATHLDPVNGPLWPGGKYGSRLPADINPDHRGTCGNCHRVHGWPDGTAPDTEYPSFLVEREENLCYTCHDDTGEGKDVRTAFQLRYRHPVSATGRHDPAEAGDPVAYSTGNRHAECVDCHNPHRLVADNTAPTPPAASSANAGVSRVSVTNLGVNNVRYTWRGPDDSAPVQGFELCFKCHSGWTTQPSGQADLGQKFNTRNQSYHPVEAIGRNTNIKAAAFVAGWRATSRMLCTDCHGGSDPATRGPHGSNFRYLLSSPYTASSSRRTMSRNELCFDCHSYDTYANKSASQTKHAYSRFNRPSQKKGHSYHVGEKRYPCYACHDTHGAANRPHLIVTGRSPGIQTYSETSTGGYCNPTCHGNKKYKINYAR